MEKNSLEAQTFKNMLRCLQKRRTVSASVLTEFEGYSDKTKLDHLYSISEKSTRNRSDYRF